MARSQFTEHVIEIIREIPTSQVTTYGHIAGMAGNPRAARQVARILHSCAEKENLPWWRVVNRDGCIVLKSGFGYEDQEDRLLAEGVTFRKAGQVDLMCCAWPADQDH